MALVSAGETEEPTQLWSELHEALRAWVSRYGNPHAHVGLHKLIQRGHTGAERFLSAFTKTGTLIQGLLTAPSRPAPRYTGRLDDVAAQAELLARGGRALTVADLWTLHESLGGPFDKAEILRRALAAGWCLDGESWIELVPASAYYTGDLWPKYDRAQLRAKRAPTHPSPHYPTEAYQPQAEKQAGKLLSTIAPAVFEDIDGVSPRQAWVPLDLVQGWINERLVSTTSPSTWRPQEGARAARRLGLRRHQQEGHAWRGPSGRAPPHRLAEPRQDPVPARQGQGQTTRTSTSGAWPRPPSGTPPSKGWVAATPERRATPSTPTTASSRATSRPLLRRAAATRAVDEGRPAAPSPPGRRSPARAGQRRRPRRLRRGRR
ncbi:MAG: hypothetical protein IPI35_24740 [Deltaproteobacteria bacterium]|nr:hypothetical protein [Deltaproteobacteria bacterium]